MEDLETRLVKNNWINLQQLVLAGQEAKRLGKTIWVALIKLGILSQEEVAVFFAQESGVPYVKISDFKISPELIRLLSEDFCRQHLIIPFCKLDDTLYIAAINPLDTALQDYLTTKTGYKIEFLFTCAYSVHEALNAYYGLKDAFLDSQKFIFKQEPLRSVPFYRESERVPCNVLVEFEVLGEDLVLSPAAPRGGRVRNISVGGTAVGLETRIFIPKGCFVLVTFKFDASLNSEQRIKVKGEVAYCAMEKAQCYFLGIKFVDAQKQDVQKLLALCLRK
jgi:hypothetical protein